MFIVLAVGVICIIIIVSWLVDKQKFEQRTNIFPGPRPLPFIGNALEFGSTTDLLPNLLKLMEKYGGVFKMGVFNTTLFITDIHVLEKILTSTKLSIKSPDYRFLHKWLGSGLLTAGGDRWKEHRKMLTPVFHFQILEQCVEDFNISGDILIQKLENEVGKQSVDIYPFITLCSLDIICATTMGSSINAQDNPESEYVVSVKEMCRLVMERSTSIYKQFDLLYMISKDYFKERKALRILHGYTIDLMSKRQLAFAENQNPANSDVEETLPKKRKNLLDILLYYKQNGEKITDKEIREEVATFMFAGHDTTSSAISFALHCIAANPDIQDKIVEEILTIFDGRLTERLCYRDLQNMKYLELVIKEALRLYPSVPIYAREVQEDFHIDGILYPKGVSLAVFAYGVHRCPKHYPDPERFDPERFHLENQSLRSPFAYLPFSAGPRNCIGQKFAMLEMKAIISRIVQHFELLPTIPQHKLVLVSETVLKSSTGVCIRLKKRSS